MLLGEKKECPSPYMRKNLVDLGEAGSSVLIVLSCFTDEKCSVSVFEHPGLLSWTSLTASSASSVIFVLLCVICLSSGCRKEIHPVG